MSNEPYEPFMCPEPAGAMVPITDAITYFKEMKDDISQNSDIPLASFALINTAIYALETIALWDKPLTLDELRDYGGKPVCITGDGKPYHWELSEDAEDYLEGRDVECYGKAFETQDKRRGWIAYRAPRLT